MRRSGPSRCDRTSSLYLFLRSQEEKGSGKHVSIQNLTRQADRIEFAGGRMRPQRLFA